MTSFVWVHNETTGGYAEIPEDSVEHMRGLGWAPSDPPPPAPNPAVAEALAFRAQQAAQAQAEREDDEPDTDKAETTHKPARNKE